MSEVKVNKISPRSGTDVTLGDSGDTFTVPTGVTLDTSNSTVTLPDGTVTNAKVNASAAIDYSKLNLTGNIALADLSATGTKDATTFLRGDNTFVEVVSGLTEADQWHTNANQSGTGFTLVNWERLDYGTTLPLGTGMTQSSGVFTFPSTGYYRVFCHAAMTWATTSYYCGVSLEGTNNNSTYVRIAESLSNTPNVIGVTCNASCETIFKVTNTSNDKIRMNGQAVANTTFVGNTNYAATSITFIKLAEI